MTWPYPADRQWTQEGEARPDSHRIVTDSPLRKKNSFCGHGAAVWQLHHESKRPYLRNPHRHQGPILCACMEEQTKDGRAHPTPVGRREVGRSDAMFGKDDDPFKGGKEEQGPSFTGGEGQAYAEARPFIRLRGLCPHMKNSRLCRGIIVLPFFSCAPGNGSIHSFILIWPFVMPSFMRMPPCFILAVAKPLDGFGGLFLSALFFPPVELGVLRLFSEQQKGQTIGNTGFPGRLAFFSKECF